MNIAVAGTGYVGLATAVCLAEQGHSVVCVDVDKGKIDLLQQGKCLIYEADLEPMMHRTPIGSSTRRTVQALIRKPRSL